MNVDQTEFRTAVLDPDRRRPKGLTDGHGREAGRRFDVYRNNVAVSLTEALETAFPVIARLLGDQNFRTMAGVFLRKHPPASPLMMYYGAEMPTFLRDFQPTASIGYLPDIARLELALRESYHASDRAPVDPEILQTTAPEQLMALTVTLAPSLRLVRSSWPIHAIWRFNTESDAPKPEMAAEDVVILRSDLDPEPHLLPVCAGIFLGALLAGETFGEALDKTTASSSDFDLSAVLGILIGAGAITAIGD
ncbi:MAG: putative DNA-binding domain-containing protein [Silicimonas sp.]|nr:putative DNA-binding domain-containing protein [Silicimonas sp.]